MKNKKENLALIYTSEFSKELTKRYLEYKTGKVKMIDSVESKKRAQAILNLN